MEGRDMTDKQPIKEDDIWFRQYKDVNDTLLWQGLCISTDSEEHFDFIKQQILDALELQREINNIKANMKTSEYLYSGEFSKHIMDRISKIFGDMIIQ